MAAHRLALTAGEPAGIGPELLVRIAQQAWAARLIALADPQLLRQTAAQLGLPLSLTEDLPDARQPVPAGSLAFRSVPLAAPVIPGLLDARNAAATRDMLRVAADGALAGHYDAIVTAPVQKSVLDQPAAPFSGHTEFFQLHAGCERVVMLLVAPASAARPPLRVALATTHLPLRAVADAITAERLHQVLAVLRTGLRRYYTEGEPTISVLGLNPHAGESGHLGQEEQRVISPLLVELRAAGWQLDGPLPADTAFNPDQLRRSDAYLAMYHDQGLPVLKFAGFGTAVNVTLGLPYVRTSVDHGTALDIAGAGRADPGSMICAIQEAIRMLDRSAHARA